MKAVSVETKLGWVYVTPVSADHVYVSTRGDYGDALYALTVRGVQISASMHLEHVNGHWQLYCNKVYASRLNSDKPVTGPQQAAIKAVVLESVTQFLDDNPQVLREAQRESLRNEIDRLTGEINDLEEKLRELRTDRNVAETELQKLEA